MEKKRRVWKWVGIGFGIFLILFLAAAIIVPLVVDVDSYRPKIVELAEEKIDGKLELGKLSLSLWGQIRVQVDGFSLADNKGRKVVSAEDVYFYVPWSSLIVFSPQLNFHMKKPEVFVYRDKKGVMNVSTLMKAPPPAAPEVPTAETPEAEPMQIPGIVKRMRFGIEMLNAAFTYEDKVGGVVSKTKDVNLIVKDVSLNRPSSVEFWAELDTQVGKTIFVKGPARFTATGKPEFEGRRFKESNINFKFDLNDMEILVKEAPSKEKAGVVFTKKKGVDAFAEGTLRLSNESFVIDEIKTKFHNAVLKGKGRADKLGGFAATGSEAMTLELSLESEAVALKPWSELITALNTYDLEGTFSLKAGVNGAVDKIGYYADLSLQNASVSAPSLKVKPKIAMALNLVTDHINNMEFSLKAPAFDLRVKGDLKSFIKPVMNVAVLSSGMDLDKLIKFEPKKETKTAAKKETGGSTAGGGGGVDVDYDALVAPLRKNEILRKATGKMRVMIKSITFQKMRMTNITSKSSFRNLRFSVDKFGMQVFDGSINSKGSVSIAPKTPTYDMTLNIASVDLQKAVKSQFAPFKDTLLGQASMNMQMKGSSFNPEPAKMNLKAKGKMTILDAQFTTMDIGRMATDAINKSMTKVAKAVPQLRGRTVKPPNNLQSKYETVTADFSIGGGKFSSPNFFGKAIENQGIDIQGNTQVGLVDNSLAADWVLIDTYNLTKARDLSVNIGSLAVPHLLADGGGPVRFPVKVSGTIFAPQVSYIAVPEALVKVALNSIKRAGEARVKAEVESRAKAEAEKLQRQVAPKLENAIKGLFK